MQTSLNLIWFHMANISTPGSISMHSPSVARVYNGSSPLDVSIPCMLMTLSSFAVPPSSGTLSIHMEGNFGQFVGGCMDNVCRSSPLPPNGNLGKASFNVMVKNVSSSPRLLVQEAPTITIPIVEDVVVQATFYNTNGIICSLNGLWP
jgi:hypothetical protein